MIKPNLCLRDGQAFNTRVEKHRKIDTPVGEHLTQCEDDSLSSDLSWTIIDQATSRIKFVIREALQIRKEQPRPKTSYKIRSKELTVNLYTQNQHKNLKNFKISKPHQKMECLRNLYFLIKNSDKYLRSDVFKKAPARTFKVDYIRDVLELFDYFM